MQRAVVVADVGDVVGVIVVRRGVDVYKRQSPDPVHNLLAADKLPPLLDQEQQNLHGDALQFEHTPGMAQRIGLSIELEVLSKSDGF